MLKKRITYLGLGLLFIITLGFGTYKLMNARSFQLFGTITSHVDTHQKAIALTFDDGPTKNVSAILSLLDDYNTKATFFLIGKEIEENLEEAKKIVQAGHQIGNHTYSHQRMVFKSPTFYKNEIEQTDELISSIGYTETPLVRPPYGKKLIGLPYYLSKNNRDTITWNLEPDSYFSSVEEKINYVKENIPPGSIILMHPMYDDTGNELQAIAGILKTLIAEGYTFVTIEELKKLEWHIR